MSLNTGPKHRGFHSGYWNSIDVGLFTRRPALAELSNLKPDNGWPVEENF